MIEIKRKRTRALVGKAVLSAIIISLLVISVHLQRTAAIERRLIEDELVLINTEINTLHYQQALLKADLQVAEQKMLSTYLDSVVEVCDPSSTFKSWMPYTAITDRSSAQWQLLQEGFEVDITGVLVQNGYMMAALSGRYGPVGTKYQITIGEDTVIDVVIADIKQHVCTSVDGSMIEFLVDASMLDSRSHITGSFDWLYTGPITQIIKIK